jgi:hypothetical protein
MYMMLSQEAGLPLTSCLALHCTLHMGHGLQRGFHRAALLLLHLCQRLALAVG